MICGWLCPFGWAQELLDKLPTVKLSKNKITYYLSYFKYVVLLLFACDLYFFDLHGLDWRWIIGLLAAAALFIYRPFAVFSVRWELFTACLTGSPFLACR